MADQLSADRLALLYRLSQAFNSTLDLSEVLDRVMDEVIAVTRAERGFLMLGRTPGDAGGDGAEGLVFRVARGMDQHTIASPEFQVSRGIVQRVASEGRPLLTSDAQHDQWLSGRASVAGLGLRSVLCVPLQLKGNTFGVIYVDNRLQAGIFSQDDLDLLVALANQAATAVENARLYAVAIEKGRMERELQMARATQANLIPRTTPHIAGYEFAAFWQPAREVSGDFYDFMTAVGSEGIGLVIADVSDKGMPAALFMALTRSVIRASITSETRLAPAEQIAHANRVICADAADGNFVTLLYARLNPTMHELCYVNAGHPPPMLFRVDRDELATLAYGGLPLGIFDRFDYVQHLIQLNAGDFVAFYTDGVAEAADAQGEQFGEARLRNILYDSRRASAADIAGALAAALREFIGEAAPFDDITCVLMKRQ
jgi:sigma-B regulation protein RsbU (phosphoserine phosphatase)